MPFGDSTEATKARLEKAVVRRKLRTGEVFLSELLDDIPPCILNTPTLFVLDMIPYVGNSALAQVNHEACRRGINLALPLGALTERAKGFLKEWDKKRQAKSTRNNGKAS